MADEGRDREAVLRYWFGEIVDGFPSEDRDQLWWVGGPEVDREIRERFDHLLSAAADGRHDDWKREPRGRLALILLLDQFTRNIYRGTECAFSHDDKALSLCLEGLELGQDRRLGTIERCFFYMPLEHSEHLKHQHRCVRLFSELVEVAPPERRKRMRGYVDFADQHKAIIERFGRFPHRNHILKRASTPEETHYLSGKHVSFGQ